MSRFLLVHGAWHGGACFDRLVFRLQQRGHQVFAPDLPGQGEDETSPSDVTLEATLERIEEHLGPKTVLVGHSLGGFYAHLVAERKPDVVKRLVYLTTLVPVPGRWQDTLDAYPGTAIDGLEVDRKTGTIPPPEEGGALFLNRVSEEVAHTALASLRPLPVGPLRDARVSDVAPTVPRVAIASSDDRAISPALVRASAEHAGVEYRELDADHAPFVSNLEATVELLHEFA